MGVKQYLLDQNHITIHTDSLCSLLQIQKYLLTPHKYDHHTHRDSIAAICQEILHRCNQGTTITLQKVKAHIGIHGNEMADTIATKGFLPHPAHVDKFREETSLDHIPSQPHTEHWWPHCKRESPQPTNPPTNTPDPIHPLSTLTQLPTPLPDLSTRPRGIYQQLWLTHHLNMIPGCRQFIFGAKIPPTARGVIIRYWYGCLYTQKLAYRFKKASNDLCPLCQKPDSGSHLLGACTHSKITGHRVNRHNDTVRIIGRLLKDTLDVKGVP